MQKSSVPNGKPKTIIPTGKRPGKRMSKARFYAAAGVVPISVGGRKVIDLEPKKMKSGKLGYFAPTRFHMTIGGITVPCQMNVTITLIKSELYPEMIPGDDDDLLAPPPQPTEPSPTG